MTFIRDLFTFYVSGFWQWLALIIGVGITGVCTFFLARWSWRWLVGIVLLLFAFIFLLILPSRQPAHLILDESTPLFLVDYFWLWMLLLIVAIVLAGIS